MLVALLASLSGRPDLDRHQARPRWLFAECSEQCGESVLRSRCTVPGPLHRRFHLLCDRCEVGLKSGKKTLLLIGASGPPLTYPKAAIGFTNVDVWFDLQKPPICR